LVTTGFVLQEWGGGAVKPIIAVDRQTIAQRIGELQLRQRDPGLSDAEKDELRALLSSRR
jgi:hypothetical protein